MYLSAESIKCKVQHSTLNMYIQLFRERLSYKQGKPYATMAKVIMGNDCFYSCVIESQGVSAWWKETAQTRICSFSFLVAESTWTSIEQNQTLTTHNANRHCRVHFYSFLGQPLSKQLYTNVTNHKQSVANQVVYHTFWEITWLWTLLSLRKHTQPSNFSAGMFMGVHMLTMSGTDNGTWQVLMMQLLHFCYNFLWGWGKANVFNFPFQAHAFLIFL